jgi:hypothetical protein
MSIKDIVAQLKEKQAESRIIPEESDPRVRAGVEAIVRNAKSELTRLESQYRTEVMGHVVVIAVNGPDSKDFAEIASKKMKTLAVDFRGVLSHLLTNLRARSASARYGQNEHFLLLDEFNRLKLTLGVAQLPAPKISHYSDGIYEAELEFAVSSLITKNYENSLYSVVSRHEIGKAALQNEFVGKYFPVVLYNYSGPIDQQFLPFPIVEFTADGNVNEKSVKAVMNDVKAKLLGNKANDPANGNTEGEDNEQ